MLSRREASGLALGLGLAPHSYIYVDTRGPYIIPIYTKHNTTYYSLIYIKPWYIHRGNVRVRVTVMVRVTNIYIDP